MKFRGEYFFLSNFFPVEVFGQRSVEHVYAAAKTLDAGWRKRILACDTPGQAKRLARKAPLREGWDAMKEDVMYKCLLYKFRHPELKAKLLATNDIEIVEENNWGDRYWGVCDGVGENRLGKLLMRVRDELEDELDYSDYSEGHPGHPQEYGDR